MLQGDKTEALKIIIEQMDQAGDNVLLRHGTIRKTYTDGADILRDKNTDQIRVSNVDPVVARKIQIKLQNLMNDQTPDKYVALIDDVIEDTTKYLAVVFLRPQFIQVCKCMKNVFVQCELWCDEILRRVARPCCTCSRHVSTQALQDLAPAQHIHISPGSSRVFAPGIEISLTPCPSKMVHACNKKGAKPLVCPAAKPTSECENPTTTNYLLYSTVYNQHISFGGSSRYTEQTPSLDLESSTSLSPESCTESDRSPIDSIFFENYPLEQGSSSKYKNHPEHQAQRLSEKNPDLYCTPRDSIIESLYDSEKWQSPSKIPYRENATVKKKPDADSENTKQVKCGFTSRTPIVTTDQMTDWQAMMVSLMWNFKAWRDWIQDYIKCATSYKYEPNSSPAESKEKWTALQRRFSNEVLQWRQYNYFSRQLTLRLVSRYRDKQIVSPTRATVKTNVYRNCQLEMLRIIDMFYRWTHWFSAIVNETNSLQQMTGSDTPLHELRWSHFKKKVEEYYEDWNKYNTYLESFWEHKYKNLISEWLPTWDQPGPIWVVSACGAVPSGAVAAGIIEGEVTWVARTTHKCNVLPAALRPSQHCCLVYADGSVHHYTKYQVMCNAEVTWVAWRAGEVGASAVCVAPGVYVGRVHYNNSHLLGAVHAPSYRCHVVIFGRPFAFNCYELLVLESNR